MKFTKFKMLIILVFITSLLFSQKTSDVNLAYSYLQNKEYSKAVALYENIYFKNQSKVYFEYYIKSLVGDLQFDKAFKVVRRYIKLKHGGVTGRVYKGFIYQAQGEDSKAVGVYNNLINDVAGSYESMRLLSNYFVIHGQFVWAEKVYLVARTKNNIDYQYNYELANIYYYQKNYPKMIDEYINLLSANDRYLATVKSKINNAVFSDTDDTLINILKDRLIFADQKYKNKVVFAELLIWAYLHDHEFEDALVQAKALDRRLNENGSRVIDIANKAMSSKKFNVAVQACVYIMNMGNKSELYYNAREIFLKANFQLVKKGVIYNVADIKNLYGEYKKILAQIGKHKQALPFYIDISKISAYYLHHPDSSLFWIQKAFGIRSLNSLDVARLNLLKADYTLVGGNIFDAALMYAKIERANKNNPIGYTAKLKKAKMAFYNCNFMWAKGQLDILKASTSKLSANNAADLSILIHQNMDEDTTNFALCLYSKVCLEQVSLNIDSALLLCDSIIYTYNDNSIVDETLIRKATMLKSLERFSDAIKSYRIIVDKYPSEPVAAEACFNLGLLFQNENKDYSMAIAYYKKLLLNYPLSIYAYEARFNLRYLLRKKG